MRPRGRARVPRTPRPRRRVKPRGRQRRRPRGTDARGNRERRARVKRARARRARGPRRRGPRSSGRRTSRRPRRRPLARRSWRRAVRRALRKAPRFAHVSRLLARDARRHERKALHLSLAWRSFASLSRNARGWAAERPRSSCKRNFYEKHMPSKESLKSPKREKGVRRLPASRFGYPFGGRERFNAIVAVEFATLRNPPVPGVSPSPTL